MKKPKTNLERFLEILPGSLTWGTLISAPILSYFHPAWVAVYIILFDMYWFLKGANVAIHLVWSYRKLKLHNRINWQEWLTKLTDKEKFLSFLDERIRTEPNQSLVRVYKDQLTRIEKVTSDRDLNWERIYHLIIIPTFQEDLPVLEASIESFLNSDYPSSKLVFVLAAEERGGDKTVANAKILEERYAHKFFKFLKVIHPDGLEGEAKVKGANTTFGAKVALKFFTEQGILLENIIVSNFDSDTNVPKNYFSHLSFDFLTSEKPLQASFQPMPMFHNNIWDTPAIARVIATSSSFWQLVEASRPDRLVTFSSHSMSFKTLVDVGFWRTDIIPEDSHIFWQCFLHFKGSYRTEPLFTTVSMDAVLGENYIGTLIAQYKQKRRWAWGVTEISMVIPEFFKNNKIPLWKRFIYAERLIEGHYFWATASIMIPILGWLPLLLGSGRFDDTVLALNLPLLTRVIMTIATIFLAFSVYISLVLLPPRPKNYSKWKNFGMVFQWVLSPIVSSVFGSLPAIDAQTRLMFGKYMEFWVTPKIRKNNVPIVEQEQASVNQINS